MDGQERDAPLMSGWFSKQGEGWFSGWRDRFFAIWGNGEFNYYATDDLDGNTTALGNITLGDIQGLKVVSNVAGTGRPGLVIDTSRRVYNLASEADKVEDLERWVQVLLGVREGRIKNHEDMMKVLGVGPQEVLMEFSMSSSSSSSEDEEVGNNVQNSGKGQLVEQDIQQQEQQQQQDEEVKSSRGLSGDQLEALRAIGAAWDHPVRRTVLERAICRTINHLTGGKPYRVRCAADLNDGTALCALLGALKVEPPEGGSSASPEEYWDERSRGRGPREGRISAVQAALATEGAVDSGQAARGDGRALLSFAMMALVGYWMSQMTWSHEDQNDVEKKALYSYRGAVAVLQWAADATAGHSGVRIVPSEPARSACDGMALCALLHRYRPNAVDYETLHAAHVQRNVQRCLTKAKEELDVPLLLDPSDFLDPQGLDDLALLLYLTAFMMKAEPKCVLLMEGK